jgi:hypothetical protein
MHQPERSPQEGSGLIAIAAGLNVLQHAISAPSASIGGLDPFGYYWATRGSSQKHGNRSECVERSNESGPQHRSEEAQRISVERTY